jgi:hypothetical protein
MSQNWYVMAFGVELGPMSRDDLRGRARCGDLRHDSQVRQGECGPFIDAREVPGLFGPSVVETPESAWFCELLGAELGPMSWKELCQLAERGTLRGDARVRCGDGQWTAASSVSGLIPASAAVVDRSEVRPAAPPAKVLEPTTEVSEPLAKAVASPASARSATPRKEQVVEKKPPSGASSAPVHVAEPPTVYPPATAPPTKAVKKAARTSPARPRTPIRVPGKALAVLAGGVLIACAGYFGWAHWTSKSARPDYQRVAALYRQVHEQIKQFRSKAQNQSPVGLQFQFSRTVSALRRQLEQLAGDASAGRLAEAGTQLTQMLADCQAASGSAEATRFTETEQRFLATLDSFQNGQP